jgi:hypothetical protein
MRRTGRGEIDRIVKLFPAGPGGPARAGRPAQRQQLWSNVAGMSILMAIGMLSVEEINDAIADAEITAR